MKRKILSLITILSITALLAGCGNTASTGLTNEISALESKDTLEKTTIEVVEINESASVEDVDGSLTVVTDSGDTIPLDKDGVENEDGSTTYTIDDETKVTVKEDGSAVVTKEEEKVVPVEEEKPKDEKTTPSPSKEPEKVHKHSYNVEVTKEATCSQEGTKTFTCECGDTYTETIEKTAHTVTEFITEVEPTCIKEGSKIRRCSVCNATVQSQLIDKVPHITGEWEVIDEVSCTENGVKVRSCIVCGQETDRSVTAAPGHKSEWVVEEEPNCSKEGKKVRVCTVCNVRFEEKVITKTGHIESDWEVVTAANCLTEGVKVKKCTVCKIEMDKSVIAKTDHSVSDWIIVSNPTCVANGSKHKVCTVCNVEIAVEAIPTSGTHNFAWETNGDTRTMKCNGCGSTGITEYCYNGAWGYYDDGAANTLWGYVNTTRNNTQYAIVEQGVTIGVANVASLNSNGDLTNKARNRAVEAAVNFNHGSNTDECLAWGQGSPEAAMDSWLMSSGHTSAITDPAYITGGIACFYFDSDGSGTNLTPIWVLELGY